jgi:hypothetical protein
MGGFAFCSGLACFTLDSVRWGASPFDWLVFILKGGLRPPLSHFVNINRVGFANIVKEFKFWQKIFPRPEKIFGREAPAPKLMFFVVRVGCAHIKTFLYIFCDMKNFNAQKFFGRGRGAQNFLPLFV